MILRALLAFATFLTLARPVLAQSEGAIDYDLKNTPIERFQAVTERPLFTPGRRPSGSEAVIDGGGGDGGGDAFSFQLKGVVVDPGREHALLFLSATGKSRRVAVGEQVDGWTVEAITEKGVAFVKDGVRQFLALRHAK